MERNDIWLVPEARGAAALHEKLEKAFKHRVDSAQRFPLAWALYDTFRFDFWLGGVCQLLTALTQVMAPFMLRYLITYAKNAYNANLDNQNPAPPIAEGLGYVIGISAMQVVQSFALSHFYYRSMLMGGAGRGAITALALDKSLRLSTRAKAGRRITGEETGGNRIDQEGCKQQSLLIPFPPGNRHTPERASLITETIRMKKHQLIHRWQGRTGAS